MKPASAWKYVLADLETNGLLVEVDKVHCLCAIDMHTEELRAFSTLPVGTEIEPGICSELLEVGLALLRDAEIVYGHNWLRYDAMVLNKLYGTGVDPRRIRDTLILSQLLWPEIAKADMGRAKKGIMPRKLIGRHSIESWGYRLGEQKGTFGQSTDWLEVSVSMVAYCAQDVRVNLKLAKHIGRKLKEGWLSPKGLLMEHEIALLCEQMSISGFWFDHEGAVKLYAELACEVDRLTRELQQAFPPKLVQTTFIPKVNNAKLGYKKGIPFVKEKRVPLNPNSREQIAERLIERYGWVPARNPDTGRAVVDDEALAGTDYPETPLLRSFLDTNKILGMVATGKNAWLKMERGNAIHGSVNTAGAVTRRCTHSSPNVAQTPKVQKGKEGVLRGAAGGFGWECRSLFTAPPGWVLVGADQAALELRCLGHYMAIYDDGDYIRVVLDGDVHTVNKEAAGLSSRDQAKTFIYGFLYGAGDAKIGEIVAPNGDEKERTARGKKLKADFLKGLPALASLRKMARAAAEEGFIEVIDGSKLPIRKAHAALNTLLQSAGALACKTWVILLVKALHGAGLKWDVWNPERGDFFLSAFVHDEVQIACRPEHADLISRIACETASEAGEALGFACRLDGDAKVGRTWAETH